MIRIIRFLKDLKYLFKRFVLIANVLPVLFGFLIAWKYYGVSFSDYFVSLLLLITGSGMLVAGALACNNWLEADVDKLMERTKNRPTVTGTMSLRTVLWIGLSLSFIGQLLLLFINFEVAVYGWIGWFTYVVVYTIWTKRRVTWNTHIGSLSGAVTPLMGWAVIDPAIHVIPLSLFLIMFLWQMPHTYAIAIRKYDDYARAGLKMLPVVKGYQTTICRTSIYIALLIFVPLLINDMSPAFYILLSLLNIAWLMIGIKGFRTKDVKKWADQLFISSLIYLVGVYTLYLIFV
ncbi:protoheme IX farnesyltransferase [Gracilibacillus ureilyticus]|uniref:Protoheme IX farnesyltransferase n=1 Tax=Gracilibacillus ureilyticus TaxID=531814 RepID=A0A1H9VKL9_9BACI|nr:heme o synthase [Gracilibacillus ureilyticus]SES22061.1 protoheme IX farnesyltransferase [Gracilibacillus ureilyticus]